MQKMGTQNIGMRGTNYKALRQAPLIRRRQRGTQKTVLFLGERCGLCRREIFSGYRAATKGDVRREYPALQGKAQAGVLSTVLSTFCKPATAPPMSLRPLGNSMVVDSLATFSKAATYCSAIRKLTASWPPSSLTAVATIRRPLAVANATSSICWARPAAYLICFIFSPSEILIISCFSPSERLIAA